MTGMRVGIDSYGLYPLKLSPLEILKWARENGAQGVQFSGLFPEQRPLVDPSYLREMSGYARENKLYLEWGGGQHIPYDTVTWKKKDIDGVNRQAAERAADLGTRIVRTSSGGLIRWRDDSPPTETLLRESAAVLRRQRRMLKDLQVVLAIETHFEFTSHELVRLFDMCDAEPGDYLGICLDTMNLLTMLEDPLSASRRLLPWVECTHIKDGGILLNSKGLTAYPTAIGEGIVDLESIVRLLARLPRQVNLSIEDHGGRFHMPIFDPLFLSRFPDLTVQELALLVKTAAAGDDQENRILEREQWPRVCKSRLRQDVDTLKNRLTVTWEP